MNAEISKAMRNTNEFYSDSRKRVAQGHMDFIKAHAGNCVHDAAAATGDYVDALIQSGYTATGSDLNDEYVLLAKKRNLPVVTADASALNMEDNSVDTILLFEILEHIADSATRCKILREAKRVARKNVLVTTPNSNSDEMLRRCGLTYEHMLEQDHKVFFNDEILKADFDKVFERYDMNPAEQIEDRLYNELFMPRMHTWILRAMKMHSYTPKLFFRYYVVGHAS